MVAPLTGVSAADVDSELPLADAGLDQQTPVGATVQLDATGSRDPDGTIAAYNWTIETPNGSTVTPACRSCGRTSFRPYRIGQYNVTVTVTDDEGHTHADTLHLTAEPGRGPTVDVSGPENPIVGANTTYTADSTAGNVPLDRIEWQRNGSTAVNQSLSGEQQTVDHGFSFSEQGETNVTAIVVDVAGQQANASMTVDPRTASRGGNGGGNAPQGYYQPNLDGGTYLESEGSSTAVSPFTGESVGTVVCCSSGGPGDSFGSHVDDGSDNSGTDGGHSNGGYNSGDNSNTGISLF
ncbi:PKD domain-containing protein [Halorientalis brevis]|uniref:PKD domain-containing protein n=1 Tax=Halorientalis brevis TaxID=1126241 RepID=A0ABD6C7K7_9EURY|nr:PKD domain-containing protein [Halorientalis brevis]